MLFDGLSFLSNGVRLQIEMQYVANRAFVAEKVQNFAIGRDALLSYKEMLFDGILPLECVLKMFGNFPCNIP